VNAAASHLTSPSITKKIKSQLNGCSSNRSAENPIARPGTARSGPFRSAESMAFADKFA
jgi:hypothetical protein